MLDNMQKFVLIFHNVLIVIVTLLALVGSVIGSYFYGKDNDDDGAWACFGLLVFGILCLLSLIFYPYHIFNNV